MYLWWLVINAPNPDPVVGLSKKIVNSSNLDLVMLEQSDLEPLLDFFEGLGFPTLRAVPIDALAWVPLLVGPLAFRPTHVPVPPGVAMMSYTVVILRIKKIKNK